MNRDFDCALGRLFGPSTIVRISLPRRREVEVGLLPVNSPLELTEKHSPRTYFAVPSKAVMRRGFDASVTSCCCTSNTNSASRTPSTEPTTSSTSSEQKIDSQNSI